MKVIEQKILDGVKTEIISEGKKKFIRVSKFIMSSLLGKIEKVEWKRYKTNHTTKKSEHTILEDEYNKKFKVQKSPDHYFNGMNLHSSGSTIHHEFVNVQEKIEDDKERKRLEKGLVVASCNGEKKIVGVKYIKEETGWGLLESKDFVDKFFERRDKYNKQNL